MHSCVPGKAMASAALLWLSRVHTQAISGTPPYGAIRAMLPLDASGMACMHAGACCCVLLLENCGEAAPL